MLSLAVHFSDIKTLIKHLYCLFFLCEYFEIFFMFNEKELYPLNCQDHLHSILSKYVTDLP